MSKRILCFDPGESTGWYFEDLDLGPQSADAGTIKKDFDCLVKLIQNKEPTVVVIETFALYPGKAASLAWNTFYPCEVIGVLKYTCEVLRIPFVMQSASIKKFSGGLDQKWIALQNDLKKKGIPGTNHSQDAYLHFKYYMRAQNPRSR